MADFVRVGLLLRSFKNRCAADRTSRRTRERRLPVSAVVLDVKIATRGRFFQFHNRRIAIAFCSAGQSSDGRSASRRANGVGVSMPDRRRGKFHGIDSPQSILLHLAFRRKRVAGRSWPAVVETHLRGEVVLFGTLHAEPSDKESLPGELWRFFGRSFRIGRRSRHPDAARPRWLRSRCTARWPRAWHSDRRGTRRYPCLPGGTAHWINRFRRSRHWVQVLALPWPWRLTGRVSQVLRAVVGFFPSRFDSCHAP